MDRLNGYVLYLVNLIDSNVKPFRLSFVESAFLPRPGDVIETKIKAGTIDESFSLKVEKAFHCFEIDTFRKQKYFGDVLASNGVWKVYAVPTTSDSLSRIIKLLQD